MSAARPRTAHQHPCRYPHCAWFEDIDEVAALAPWLVEVNKFKWGTGTWQLLDLLAHPDRYEREWQSFTAAVGRRDATCFCRDCLKPRVLREDDRECVGDDGRLTSWTPCKCGSDRFRLVLEEVEEPAETTP